MRFLIYQRKIEICFSFGQDGFDASFIANRMSVQAKSHGAAFSLKRTYRRAINGFHAEIGKDLIPLVSETQDPYHRKVFLANAGNEYVNTRWAIHCLYQ